MPEYSYSINDSTNEMTVWEDNCVLCTISDVDEKQAKEMFYDVVFELRGIDLSKDTEEDI